MIELMSEERLEKFLAESCCQHGEACNDVYAAEVRAELARLRAEVERLKNPWGGHDRECLSGACHCDKASAQ